MAKKKNSKGQVYLGAYHDEQGRLRPITASKYSQSKRGVPIRSRDLKKYSKKKGSDLEVKMMEGQKMSDMITINGVTKSRRAWLTDLSLFAEPVHLDPNTGWRPDHNRSDVAYIDLNTMGNIENFSKGKTPGFGEGYRIKTKIPKKPKNTSKATIKRFKKEVGINTLTSATDLEKQGLLTAEDSSLALVVDKKKAKKSQQGESIDGEDFLLLSDNITYKDLKKKDVWELDDGTEIATKRMIDAIKILGGKGDIILKRSKDPKYSKELTPVVAQNKRGDQVIIYRGSYVPEDEQKTGKFKVLKKLDGVTDLTLFKKHKLPSRQAREAGMDRTRSKKGRTLILFDKRGTFGYRQKNKVGKALADLGLSSREYELVADPKNKSKPKSRHRYWLYVQEKDENLIAKVDDEISKKLARRRRRK